MKFLQSIVLIVSFLFSGDLFAQESSGRIIKIATGNKNALAYPILSSICTIFNKKNSDKNISCAVFETEGSGDNLNGLVSGEYDFGVIKAEMEYDAYNGVGSYFGKPYRDLRTAFGLYSEYLTIIVRNGSAIKEVKDFRNKRIYVGNKGSGSRMMANKLLAEKGLREGVFMEMHEESLDKIYNLFCDKKIDAAIYLIGHPNSIFLKTMKECDVKLVSFPRNEIERYVDIFRHTSAGTIKQNTYPNQKQNIDTIASQLLLATSSKVEESLVYEFSQIASENWQELQKMHPVLKGSKIFGAKFNVIPLHKGSARYYESLN